MAQLQHVHELLFFIIVFLFFFFLLYALSLGELKVAFDIITTSLDASSSSFLSLHLLQSHEKKSKISKNHKFIFSHKLMKWKTSSSWEKQVTTQKTFKVQLVLKRKNEEDGHFWRERSWGDKNSLINDLTTAEMIYSFPL
jgi:hypothetical protein